jgi:hypothetical protein
MRLYVSDKHRFILPVNKNKNSLLKPAQNLEASNNFVALRKE